MDILFRSFFFYLFMCTEPTPTQPPARPIIDGTNVVRAEMQLSVLLVTDAMLFNSVTLRLGDMDQESFLSQPLYNYFVDGLAAIIPCPKENVFVFNIQVT